MYLRSDNSDSTDLSRTAITGQSGKLLREGIISEETANPQTETDQFDFDESEIPACVRRKSTERTNSVQTGNNNILSTENIGNRADMSKSTGIPNFRTAEIDAKAIRAMRTGTYPKVCETSKKPSCTGQIPVIGKQRANTSEIPAVRQADSQKGNIPTVKAQKKSLFSKLTWRTKSERSGKAPCFHTIRGAEDMEKSVYIPERLLSFIGRRRKAVLAAASCLVLVCVAVPTAVYAASKGVSADKDLADFEIIETGDDLYAMSLDGVSVDAFKLSSANVLYDDSDKSDDDKDNDTEKNETIDEDVTSEGAILLSADTEEAEYAASAELLSENFFTVTLQFYDRDSITCSTSPLTLRELFAKVGYTQRDTDKLYAGLDDVIDSECTIMIDSVEYSTLTETESIPFEVETIDVQSIPRGTTQTVTDGAVGARDVVYTVEYVNGVEVSREKQYDYVVSEPVNQVEYRGVGGVLYAPDGNAYSYSYCVTVRATYYDLPGRTASGMPVGNNIVATDPSVFPLGTNMYVMSNSYDMGLRVAADTGGGVKGNLIDIWMDQSSPNFARFSSQGVAEMTAYILD